jgi:hypothetical protein
MKKQTAVEWLIESLIQYNIVPKGIHSDNVLFHKAKEIEKEQIMNAYLEGESDADHYEDSALRFYNETFSK